MLVGALFSVIGQILSVFGKKGPSEIEQMKTLLESLESEKQLEDIKAVHDNILIYADTLRSEALLLRKILRMKLENHDNYSAFYKGILEAKIVINDTNPHNSVFSFINWKVIEYLESDEHKDV